MIRDILFRLPLPVKIALGNAKTTANKNKNAAIATIDKYENLSFTGLNDPEYRANLKRYLRACTFTVQETAEYIRWLYTDNIELIARGAIDYRYPTIICVVKNEAGKLGNFLTIMLNSDNLIIYL